VLFDDVTDALTDRGQEFLDDLAQWLDEDPDAKIGKKTREFADSALDFIADRKDDEQ
jgi:hypothetical protein